MIISQYHHIRSRPRLLIHTGACCFKDRDSKPDGYRTKCAYQTRLGHRPGLEATPKVPPVNELWVKRWFRQLFMADSNPTPLSVFVYEAVLPGVVPLASHFLYVVSTASDVARLMSGRLLPP